MLSRQCKRQVLETTMYYGRQLTVNGDGLDPPNACDCPRRRSADGLIDGFQFLFGLTSNSVA